MTGMPTGGMLSRHERLVIQALLQGGVESAAEVLGMSEPETECWIAELMWFGDGRAYLARMLDARAVGLLAPKAMATVAELMNKGSDRARLAAAQMALQVVGLMRPGVDTTVAAKAAQQAVQASPMAGLDMAGMSAAELLAKIETIEGSLAEEPAPVAPAPGEPPDEELVANW